MDADGEFVVGIPLFVSEPETSVASWRANVTVDGDGSTQVRGSERGPMVEIAGVGMLAVCSTSLQHAPDGDTCCAEDYLNGEWSTGEPDPVLHVWAKSGEAHVAVEYSVRSALCGRADSYSGSFSMTGWTILTGAPSGAWCA